MSNRIIKYVMTTIILIQICVIIDVSWDLNFFATFKAGMTDGTYFYSYNTNDPEDPNKRRIVSEVTLTDDITLQLHGNVNLLRLNDYNL